MKNEYKSQDFYLCAFLMAAGVQLRSYHKENRSTVFIFEKDNKLDELIGDFYSMRASVNPVSYGQSIKNLKSIIHSNTNINSNQIQNNEDITDSTMKDILKYNKSNIDNAITKINNNADKSQFVLGNFQGYHQQKRRTQRKCELRRARSCSSHVEVNYPKCCLPVLDDQQKGFDCSGN